MKTYSTREAAKKLGVTHAALSRYISTKKIPAPQMMQIGKFRLHTWTEADIEKVRKILPKLINGRKTRYKKAVNSSQLSVVSKSKKKKNRTKSKAKN